MKDESKKKKKTGVGMLLLLILIGIPILLIILMFIVALSPTVLLGFVFYKWFEYLKERHLRNAKLKLKLNS